MKKVLTLLLSLLLVVSSAFARAGSSYKSGGYHTSSSSYSNSKSYSSSYTAPKTAPSYASTSKPSYASTSKPSYASTAPKTVIVNKHYTVNHASSGGIGNNIGGGGSGGMGILGTGLAVAGGVVAGNLITKALTDDHRNEGYAPQGGYVNNSNGNGYPAPNQSVSPQVVPNPQPDTQYITDGNGGYKPVPLSVPTNDHTDWKAVLIIIMVIVGLMIISMWIIPSLWRSYMNKKKERDFSKIEENLENLGSIFVKVQEAYSKGQAGKAEMRGLCTEEQYNNFYLINSVNEEDGFTNYVKDILVLNLTTTSYKEEDGIKLHTVKIRFSMIDYTTDEFGAVTHGSDTIPQIDAEIWQFLSTDGKVWKLNKIY